MKKAFTYLAMVAITMGAFAQVKTPAPSPAQKLVQTVGLTEITVEYSRPSVKGRTIFGGLESYDKIWRTGANQNTTIAFSDDVMIGGKTVKAGKYAVYTKPNPEKWDVYFYSQNDNWGTPKKWDDNLVVAQVTAPVYPLPMNIETMTISFDDLTNDSANLGIMWEKSYVGVKITVPTDKKVTASIKEVMSSDAINANDYYASAVYYMESGKDINQAKAWIDKAIEMREKPAFWYHRQQSLIYAKAGDKKGAIKAAKKSMALAKEAGNDSYVAMNTKSLAEWGAK